MMRNQWGSRLELIQCIHNSNTSSMNETFLDERAWKYRVNKYFHDNQYSLIDNSFSSKNNPFSLFCVWNWYTLNQLTFWYFQGFCETLRFLFGFLNQCEHCSPLVFHTNGVIVTIFNTAYITKKIINWSSYFSIRI